MADLFAKVNCTYCQEEINGVRVQCAECTDFDICLQCFTSGAEIGPHRNNHAYKLVDHCAVSIFGGRGNWTGREELQLLEAMELFGFGNWEFVAKHVQTRTREEVKDEYISRYLEGNIGKATLVEVENNRPVINDVPEDTGPLAPSMIARLPPLDIRPEEAKELHYICLREDYEAQYDMKAEEFVATIQLNRAEDSDAEIGLILAHMDIYIRRLRERVKRERLIRDYQLVAKFFEDQRKDTVKKPLSKDQEEFRKSMRVFAQLLTSGEHERLVASIERERELRHRLSELCRYRSLGLSTQEDVIHHEQHAAFHRLKQQRQSKTGSSGDGLQTQEMPLKSGRDEEISRSFIEEKSMVLPEGDSDCNNSSSSNMKCCCSSSCRDPECQPSALPLSKLLSDNEIQLCKSLNLLPAQYVTLKALILKAQRGEDKEQSHRQRRYIGVL